MHPIGTVVGLDRNSIFSITGEYPNHILFTELVSKGSVKIYMQTAS